MTYRDIDLNINDETKAMLRLVAKFGMKVMRPTGIELDKLSDPADVIAKDSKLWDVFKGFRELGLHVLQIPKKSVIDPLLLELVTERRVE